MTQTLRLYHHPMSSCSTRVRMAAHHLGLPLDLVSVDLAAGEQRGAAFGRLNPNHQVPVLVHGELVLWESYAILQYLAEQAPGQTLYPPAPAARADVNRWLFWCGQVFMPGMTILNWENAIKPMLGLGAPDPAEVQRAEALLRRAAELLDAHLAGRQWLCASGLSLADWAIAAPLADAGRARLPIGGLPQLAAWFDRVRALPAWAAVHQPATAPA